jgi:hypothetical protein
VLKQTFYGGIPVQEPELDPDFDWIAAAKKTKYDALEDNKIRFER